MIPYLEDPKNSTSKLKELINKFNKIAGYKVNTHKSNTFLYISDKSTAREIRKTTPFTVASTKIKYLRFNLTKEAKDLYSENYRTLKKEIEEDLRRWKDLPCSWISRINIVKNGHTTDQKHYTDSMQFLSKSQ